MAQILIVEDDERNLELLEWAMEDMGHQWLHAGDADAAVRLASEGTFDLVLMDITIPAFPNEPHNSEPHGLDASHQIRRRQPGIPIVAITAHGMQHMKQRVLDAGCNDILEKPFDDDDLRRKLQRWLVPQAQ